MSQPWKFKNDTKSFHIFLQVVLVVEKNFFKTINDSISKISKYQGGYGEKPRVHLLDSTIVAAVNIDGNTLYLRLVVCFAATWCNLYRFTFLTNKTLLKGIV